ncbi:phage minor capsid protein [Clostridium sp.]|uniref:phage minor capsid protein n=1 Tax=Clostridium sp. TaxID=1506 RepID=UPI00257FEC45|nr:phage minor capsid protein [Clostridium sp.]
MLRPAYLAAIAEGSEQIASELHDYIVRAIVGRMMERIGRGEKYLLTSADRWRIQILQDAGELLENITAELSLYTGKQIQEIRSAMEEAGVKALEADDLIYSAAGLSTVPLWESPALVRLMERNMNASLGEWRNYTRTTAEEAQRFYITECDKAYNRVMSGAVAYTQAVKEAVEEVASAGVAVKYPTGHTDTLETATARAVRTGIAQATGDISLKRMEEMNWDIILVSAHIGARTGDGGQNPGNHLWWQGQFYSRTGEDKHFPPFSQTGYGTGEGLCGWNCRHSFGCGDGVHNPYKDIQTEDNVRMEKLEKRQRELERRVRKTKRAVMGMQTAVEQCQDEAAKFALQQELDRKSYLLQRQNQAYQDFCKYNSLRPLSERLKIARWSREQAAKARGAARRYQNAKGAS